MELHNELLEILLEIICLAIGVYFFCTVPKKCYFSGAILATVTIFISSCRELAWQFHPSLEFSGFPPTHIFGFLKKLRFWKRMGAFFLSSYILPISELYVIFFHTVLVYRE